MRKRLGTIRGKLVLWYLSVLAILLLALGITQAWTLSRYLQSTAAESMRQAASSELCALSGLVTSSAGLYVEAQQLALLLGSQDTAVKIVTPAGETLADHGLGPPGARHPLNLSSATIAQLIAPLQPTPGGHPPAHAPPCISGGGSGSAPQAPVLARGGLILTSVPIGPRSYPFGFAILGRSSADERNTLQQTEIIFAVGAATALLIAGLVALPLINRALRPLRRIAGAAGAIARGDLGQRANLARTPDEIGQLGTAFDTMVDRLETALREANASEERMRRFLGGASHELRTPLTALRGTAEVLLRWGIASNAEASADLKPMLQAIHEESIRLSNLVDDLLTLSRLDAGQELRPEAVPVKPFLEEFVERYAIVWPDRRIDLQAGAADGAAAYVDPEALRRILSNLVDNAARYSTPGKPIVLDAGAAPSAVTVSVHDEGPGLSPEEAGRVFERFYRSAESRSRDSGGHGLGLAIVQALAKQSGGGVRLDTARGKGTTFTVTLPRKS